MVSIAYKCNILYQFVINNENKAKFKLWIILELLELLYFDFGHIS